MRPLPGLFAMVALYCAAGCTALFGEEKPPVSTPAPPPPPPPEPETCASSWKPAGKADSPPVSAFQAAIGELESSPELKELLSQLGPHELKSGGELVHVYPERGVELRFRRSPSGKRLDRVLLLRRDTDMSTYAGALPGGLSFAQTAAEAESAAGPPDNEKCWRYGAPCAYRSRGLAFKVNIMGCVAAVELFRPIAEKVARFEDMEIRDGAVEHGVHGISVSWRRTSAPVKDHGSPRTRACVLGDDGKVRKRPRWARSPHEDDDLCEAAQMSNETQDSADESVFFSYALLDQAPGPIALKLQLSTTMLPDLRIRVRGDWSLLTLAAEGQSLFDLWGSAPALRRARLNVLRAEVDKEATYDDIKTGTIAAAIATGGASLLVPVPERWARPDLQWAIYLGSTRAYKSGSISDSYSAAWSGSSSTFPLAPEDSFKLCLEDDDDGTDDRIACFDFTIESYQEQVKSGEPLSGGLVKKLVLGPAVVSK